MNLAYEKRKKARQKARKPKKRGKNKRGFDHAHANGRSIRGMGTWSELRQKMLTKSH